MLECRLMRYGEPLPDKLYELATLEAKALQIPADILDNRPVVEGDAVDAKYSRDRDDAISLSVEGDQRILRVSVADVGSFVHPDTALQAYAERQLFTRYRGHRAVKPMLPRELSERSLSLTAHEKRPVLSFHFPVDSDGNVGPLGITLASITANILTPKKLEALVLNDTDHYTELGMVAQTLFRARHNDRQRTPILQNEEGRILKEGEGSIGTFIVQESMIATNAIVAQFMHNNDIPGLFRTHIPTPEIAAYLEDFPELRVHFARARYVRLAGEHLGLNLQTPYAHNTSPLRRYPDYVNHANLIAFIEDRAFPFSADRLDEIVERLDAVRIQEKGDSPVLIDVESAIASWSQKQLGKMPQIKKTLQADLVLAKFNEEAGAKATQIDVANALFGTLVGTEEQKTIALEAATRRIATIAGMAKSVLLIAVQKGWVTLRPVTTETESEEDKARLIATVTASGKEYEYPLTKSKIGNFVRMAELVGKLAGVVIKPEIPENMKYDTFMRNNPFKHIKYLKAKFGHINAKEFFSADEEAGTTTLTVRLTLNNEVHVRSCTVEGTTAQDRVRIRRQLGMEIIEEFDLKTNIPEKPEPPTAILARDYQKRNLPEPNYQITDPTEDEPNFTCTLTFHITKDTTHTTTGTGISKKAARWAAAKEAVAMLPPLPEKEELKRQKRFPQEAPTTPVSILAVHAARYRAPRKPHYQNTTAESTDPEIGVECTLTFVNANGDDQVIVIKKASYKLAKNAAAALALKSLPPLPEKPIDKTRS